MGLTLLGLSESTEVFTRLEEHSGMVVLNLAEARSAEGS